MMPIFFNLESHLWIAYLLFFNGWLISWQLRRFSFDYCQLTSSLEAQVLAAFFLSIGLNGLLLLALQFLGFAFSSAGTILFLLSAMLILIAILNHKYMSRILDAEFSWLRLFLYAFVFIVLFYNGGLIERVSDAWWHMSLANKIGLESNFIPEKGHLTGLPTRYYPPLWHANIALVNLVSGETIPVLWNSFTAWGAVLKVMSFYLFAHALTANKSVATLAALLFILLPGIGNSYLRVSAWPSHIAYIAWFFILHLIFVVLDRLPSKIPRPVFYFSFIKSIAVPSLSIFALGLIVLFTHKAELLYLAVGVLVYFAALAVGNFLFPRSALALEPGYWGVCVLGILLASFTIYVTAVQVVEHISSGSLNPDLAMANLWPLIFLVTALMLCFYSSRLPRKLTSFVLGFMALSVLVLIDWRHAASLFQPDLAYTIIGTHERALMAPGWFGTELKIPGWHLQLRGGLLYSGVIALPVSLWMVHVQPSRASLFLAANAWAVFIICCSPYLYHWLTELLQYHSTWRIAIVIFHPLIIAMAIVSTFKLARGEKS